MNREYEEIKKNSVWEKDGNDFISGNQIGDYVLRQGIAGKIISIDTESKPKKATLSNGNDFVHAGNIMITPQVLVACGLTCTDGYYNIYPDSDWRFCFKFENSNRMPTVELFERNSPIPITLNLRIHGFSILSYVQQYLRVNFNGFELTINENLLNEALRLRR